jgi:hypothetical protein
MPLLTVKPNELQPCDVLLFHSDTTLGNAIRLLDGGLANFNSERGHNHVGLWTGKGVAEALSKGFVERGLDESIETSDVFVSVVRFAGDPDNMLDTALGTSEYPYEPVLEQIQMRLKEGDRYCFEALVLLGVVCELRRIGNVDIEERLSLDEMAKSYVLDAIQNNDFVKLLESILGQGKTPVICSGIAYKVYADAGPKYRPVILPESMHNVYNQYPENDSDLLKQFLAIHKAETDMVYNLVTPHDTWMSPNMCYELGRLEFKHLKTDF